jgi:arylformamidase
MMQIIDLSLEISNDLPVFPGDPAVDIEQLQTFTKDGWNMKRFHINGHDGTHVNVPIHGLAVGKNLDAYQVEDFIGETILFENIGGVETGLGIIVANQNIDMDLAKQIAEQRPKFVGLASQFEMDVAVEKFFFGQNLIVYERIANTARLPQRFIFHGVPLKIKEGDGSPVRAYAIIN